MYNCSMSNANNNHFRRNQLYCGPTANSAGYNRKQRYNYNNVNTFNNFHHFQDNKETSGVVRRVVFTDTSGTILSGSFQSTPSASAGVTNGEGGGDCTNFVDTTNCQPHFAHKSFRGQVAWFQDDHQPSRTYMQCSQGQQGPTHFVKIQGCKMKPQMSYRNFPHQQKNKSFRRFVSKNFNYSKPQRAQEFNNFNQVPYPLQENNNNLTHPYNNMHQKNIPESNVTEAQRMTDLPLSLTSSVSPKEKRFHSSGDTQPETQRKHRPKEELCASKNGYRNSNKKCKEEFTKYKQDSTASASVLSRPHGDLAYEDISENSIDESDPEDSISDLRQRLLPLKKQQIKREPGEICSDEERCETRNYLSRAVLVDVGEKYNKGASISIKDVKQERSTTTIHDGTSSVEGKRTKRKAGTGGRESGRSLVSKKAHWSAFHDDRVNTKKEAYNDRQTHESEEKYRSNRASSCESSLSNPSYCCSEAEVSDLKEKVDKLKKRLRKTRDKLLEVKVVGSKRAVRLQEEIDSLNQRMNVAQKKENELTDCLKVLESEVATKDANLLKAADLHEAEKQERVKFQTDLTRTYQERLAMAKENLRSLFDVEVAKMHTYFLSVYGGTSFMNNLPSPINDITNRDDLSWYPKPANIFHSSENYLEKNSAFLQPPTTPLSPFALHENYGQVRFPYEAVSSLYSPNIISNATTAGSSGTESESNNVEIAASILNGQNLGTFNTNTNNTK